MNSTKTDNIKMTLKDFGWRLDQGVVVVEFEPPIGPYSNGLLCGTDLDHLYVLIPSGQLKPIEEFGTLKAAEGVNVYIENKIAMEEIDVSKGYTYDG